MHKATRTQIDGKGDLYSEMTTVDCSQSQDMARQEFKDDADINIMLSRFGVNQQQRQVHFGDADFTIDLQQGLAAIEQTRRVYNRATPEIKNLFPTYEKWMTGMNNGQVAKEMERLDAEKTASYKKTEIESELDKEAARAQAIRDREAAMIAEQHRKGQPPSKPEATPKDK